MTQSQNKKSTNHSDKNKHKTAQITKARQVSLHHSHELRILLNHNHKQDKCQITVTKMCLSQNHEIKKSPNQKQISNSSPFSMVPPSWVPPYLVLPNLVTPNYIWCDQIIFFSPHEITIWSHQI